VTVSDEHFLNEHIQILRHEVDVGFEQVEQAAQARSGSRCFEKKMVSEIHFGRVAGRLFRPLLPPLKLQ
jgi:hypothetical protein